MWYVPVLEGSSKRKRQDLGPKSVGGQDHLVWVQVQNQAQASVSQVWAILSMQYFYSTVWESVVFIQIHSGFPN